MPQTEGKPPVFMRVAAGLYGSMFGSTKRSEIAAEMEKWDNDELFIIAHILFLQLQACEAIRQELADIRDDLDHLIALADEAQVGEEDRFDADEDDGEEDFAEDDRAVGEVVPLTPEVVASSQPPARGRRTELLSHPEPEGDGGGAA